MGSAAPSTPAGTRSPTRPPGSHLPLGPAGGGGLVSSAPRTPAEPNRPDSPPLRPARPAKGDSAPRSAARPGPWSQRPAARLARWPLCAAATLATATLTAHRPPPTPTLTTAAPNHCPLPRAHQPPAACAGLLGRQGLRSCHLPPATRQRTLWPLLPSTHNALPPPSAPATALLMSRRYCTACEGMPFGAQNCCNAHRKTPWEGLQASLARMALPHGPDYIAPIPPHPTSTLARNPSPGVNHPTGPRAPSRHSFGFPSACPRLPAPPEAQPYEGVLPRAAVHHPQHEVAAAVQHWLNSLRKGRRGQDERVSRGWRRRTKGRDRKGRRAT